MPYQTLTKEQLIRCLSRKDQHITHLEKIIFERFLGGLIVGLATGLLIGLYLAQ